MDSGVSRRLSYLDSHGDRRTIGQDEIDGIAGPIVILGDPGSGKSVLTRVLGQGGQAAYFRAGTFVRSPVQSIMAGHRVIIDGLDEIASTALGGGVDDVLARLSAMGAPPFILSCREADWRGASDRIKIEDDYGRHPLVLHLLPFEREDAVAFLETEFPTIDAELTLDHLSARGLEEIYRNPLTLRFLGDVAVADGALPDTRVQLLDRACRVMLREDNPRHGDASHARRSDEALLLGAGAVCAAQLLFDLLGVVVRGPCVDGWSRLSDLSALPFADGAEDALHTRLFTAEGENRFSPVHRVIAEYLGAKWIAACFDSGVSERRIFSLFHQGEGVPTSLRGLHAWIAHFSEALAPRCITADPYAVLAYGDADTLRLDSARKLLDALARLSSDDPHFRAGDWVDHTALGLMRPELKNELLAVITQPRVHTQLTVLLLRAMVRTPVIRTLAPDLETIALSPERYYVERLRAAEALTESGLITDPADFLRRVMRVGGADSARLAGELLGDINLDGVPNALIVEILLAHVGLSVCHLPPVDDDSRSASAYISSELANDFDAERLSAFLDLFTDYAWPLLAVSDRFDSGAAVEFARKLVLRRLTVEPRPSVGALWGWLSGSREADGHDDDAKTEVISFFRDNPDLRTAMIRHALLDAGGEGVRLDVFHLGEVSRAFYLTSADISDLLLAGGERGGTGDLDRKAWEDLIRLSRTDEGVPPDVMDAAVRAAADDADLLAVLPSLAVVEVPEWRLRQSEREATAAARRDEAYKSHRDAHTARAAEVAAGDFGDLDVPADVYLGRMGEFNRKAAPMERLEAFLGANLAAAAADGFIAVLRRDDLPAADAIAELHAQRRSWTVEEPMVCGAAEMVRRGLDLNTLKPEVLEAVMMAWRRSTESNVVGGVDIGGALEAAVFDTEAAIERHFRRSIEPQLPALAREHVEDLYWLCQKPRWAALAGRLCAEWLVRYPDLQDRVMSDILNCALDKADAATLAEMLSASRRVPAANFDALRLWLSADFELDFEACVQGLEQAAADDPNFFWVLRPRIVRQRHSLRSDLSIAQMTFIIRVFTQAWSRTPRPGGATMGDSNAWDASEVLEKTIYALSALPTPEASNALQGLIAGPDSGYRDTLRHALGLQRRARRDQEYTARSIPQLAAVMGKGLPESIDDMRAYLADRLDTFQARVKGSNTDIWQAFWRQRRPHTENVCRNRLIDYISGLLPPSIRFEPEMHMLGQKRADIAAIRNAIGLPVEIKGQWHPALWTAPVDQLAAQYLRDWRAEGRGVYVVLWFGDGVAMPAPPDGSARPATPEEMKAMLVDRLPEERRDQIDVHVLDLARR